MKVINVLMEQEVMQIKNQIPSFRRAVAVTTRKLSNKTNF